VIAWLKQQAEDPGFLGATIFFALIGLAIYAISLLTSVLTTAAATLIYGPAEDRVLAIGFLLFALTVLAGVWGQIRSWRRRPRTRYGAAPAPPRDRIKAIGGSNYVTADERYGRAA